MRGTFRVPAGWNPGGGGLKGCRGLTILLVNKGHSAR